MPTDEFCIKLSHYEYSGMDPIFASVIASSAAGVVGFVAGGAFHRGLWSMFNRDLSRQVKAVCEWPFRARIAETGKNILHRSRAYR